MTGLDTALTPLRFLRRVADVYPDKTAIVDGPRRFSYTDAAESATALARAIAASGVDLRVIPTNPDTSEKLKLGGQRWPWVGCVRRSTFR